MKTGFPTELLTPDDSILCLFSAAFYGLNDVRHIHKVGCKYVMLMDNDKVKLQIVAARYGYNYDCLDIFEWLKTTPNEVWDVIVCDQWSNQDELIHVDYFQTLQNMSKRHLILGCTEMWLQGKRPLGEYYKRSDFNGGVYWRVVK